MRRIVFLALGLAAHAASAQAPAPRDLVINEVMYDPPPAQGSGNEWIELYNRSDQPLDLSLLRLADAADTTDVASTPTPIEPGAYAVLVRDAAAFQLAYPGVPFVEVPGFPTLNNSGDTPTILFGDVQIDRVPYLPGWGGSDASLERIDPGGASDDPANFATSTDPAAGTPGARNSVFSVDETPPALADVFATDALTVEVFFDEPVEAASAGTADHYAISDGIGTPAQAAHAPDGDPAHVTLTLAAPLTGPRTYTLTASDISDPAGNVLGQDAFDFFFAEGDAPQPRDVVLNEIMYDPPPSHGSGNEWVELYNRSDRTFSLGQLRFADAADTTAIPANAGALEPGAYAVLAADGAAFELAFPGVAYVEVPGFPTLNNGGDRPALLFEDAEVDAVPFLPGWGGADAALERIDPDGPSAFASNFAGSADPAGGTPGAQNSVFAPDTAPPRLLRAAASDPALVDVYFDEPVDPASASDPGHYRLDGGLGAPLLAETAPEGDPAHVRLVLETPLEVNTSYTLTVTDIADFVGNVLDQAETTFFFGEGAAPAPREIVVNEFLFDEPAAGSPGEWIELYNRSDQVFDLTDFTLGDSGGEAPAADAPAFVLPGGYAVLVENAAAFGAVFPGVPALEVPGWRALNNSGDAVVLRAGGVTVDSLFFDDAWGGEDASLERRDPDGPSAFAVNWRTTTDPRGGTPGARNSTFEPDTTPPRPLAATVGLDGRSVSVVFDEPLDPGSISPAAFTITGDAAPQIDAADYALDPAPTAALALAAPLGPGAYSLAVSGVRDLLGNATEAATLDFAFTPDETPPALSAAFAADSLTIEVRFSESVTTATAGDPARYQIDGGIGAPDSVAFPVEGDAAVARLYLGAALVERQVYTLTASGISDQSGNVLDAASVPLFFGEGDVPLPAEVIVNEILFDPLNGGAGEYVELFNPTDKLFDLRRFALTDDTEPDAAPIAETPTPLLPGGFVVLAANRDSFAVAFPEAPGLVVEARAFPGLNNDEDALVLTYDGVVIDSVAYDAAWHRAELEDAAGIALERIDPAGPSTSAANWTSSLDPSGGTPGRENTAFVVPGEAPGAPGLTVDSPFDPDAGQSAALRYTLATDAALVRVRIFDGAGRLVRRLEDGALTGRTGALLWDGRDDAGRRLRIGIYVALLEAVNVEGGTTEAYRAAVVVARRF